MRLPLTIVVTGGEAVSDAVVRYLPGTAREAGWERGRQWTPPGTLVFRPPPRRTGGGVEVGVWRDPETKELMVGALEQGEPISNWREYQDAAVDAFRSDVIDPIVRGIKANVEVLTVLGIDDMLPPRVATALVEFLDWRRAVPEEAAERFPGIVALIHKAQPRFDGAMLGRWLEEDMHWSSEEAKSLAVEFDAALLALRTPEAKR